MNRSAAEILRFCTVGLCVTGLYASSAYAAAKADVNPAWANVLAYTITTPVAFVGQCRFTFGKTDRPAQYLWRFLIVVLLVNGIIHVIGRCWPVGGSDALLAFVSWIVLTTGNFLAFKYWVFR